MSEKEWQDQSLARLRYLHEAFYENENDPGTLSVGVALDKLESNKEPYKQKDIEGALKEMLSSGLRLKSEITDETEQRVWKQGDFLIPMLMGVHPLICLQYIQKIMTGLGFSNQQEYRDFIEKKGLQGQLTPFSHARNNVTFSLTWIHHVTVIRSNYYTQFYPDFLKMLYEEQPDESLKQLLDITNEKIRSVLFSDTNFKEAETILIGEQEPDFEMEVQSLAKPTRSIDEISVWVSCNKCQSINSLDTIECSFCEHYLVGEELEIHAEIEEGTVSPVGISVDHAPQEGNYSTGITQATHDYILSDEYGR